MLVTSIKETEELPKKHSIRFDTYNISDIREYFKTFVDAGALAKAFLFTFKMDKLKL